MLKCTIVQEVKDTFVVGVMHARFIDVEHFLLGDAIYNPLSIPTTRFIVHKRYVSIRQESHNLNNRCDFSIFQRRQYEAKAD